MGLEWGGHIKCAHGSSPQLTLCTLKILDVSCLQLYLSHLLTLTMTFFPQIVSPLSHGKIGTADCQLIPDNLFTCWASCSSTMWIKKKSSDAYIILLFLVLKKLLSWYSNSNPDDRNLHCKERQVEISHQLNKLSYASGYILQYLFRITPTLLNVQNAEQVIVLSATS